MQGSFQISSYSGLSSYTSRQNIEWTGPGGQSYWGLWFLRPDKEDAFPPPPCQDTSGQLAGFLIWINLSEIPVEGTSLHCSHTSCIAIPAGCFHLWQRSGSTAPPMSSQIILSSHGAGERSGSAVSELQGHTSAEWPWSIRNGTGRMSCIHPPASPLWLLWIQD